MSLAKNTLSAAICGALAVYATASSAWVPTWPSDVQSPNIAIWHSGASASTATVQGAVVDALCDTSVTRDIDDPANPGHTITVPDIDVLQAPKNFWAIACTGKSTLPASLAGKHILYNKRDSGGSGVGVGPVALASSATPFPIGFMKPSTGAGTHCPAITSTANVGGATNVPVWACDAQPTPVDYDTVGADDDPTTWGTSQVPTIGTSDIEPDKFTYSLNIPAADFNLNGSTSDQTLPNYDPGQLTNEAYTELVFGVIGNIQMYQDLQRAQFPSGSPDYDKCNPAGANYGSIANFGDNANSQACMPSLTGQEVRSLTMTGRIKTADQLQAETVYNDSTSYAALNPTATSGTTDNKIAFCRRVPGSGTQAQFNAIFLGYPCDPNASDLALNTLQPAIKGLSDPLVYLGEGAGDVETCMDDFTNGTNATGANSSLSKRWAIGLQSTEKNQNLAHAYRYFKIDGYAPTLANVHAGDYYDYVGSSIQYNTTAASQGVKDAFAAIVQQFEVPAKLSVLNGPLVYSWGQAGFLAPPSSTNVPDNKFNPANPINQFRRVDFSSRPNTCALPSQYVKTGDLITVGPQNCSASNGGAGCY